MEEKFAESWSLTKMTFRIFNNRFMESWSNFCIAEAHIKHIVNLPFSWFSLFYWLLFLSTQQLEPAWFSHTATKWRKRNNIWRHPGPGHPATWVRNGFKQSVAVLFPNFTMICFHNDCIWKFLKLSKSEEIFHKRHLAIFSLFKLGFLAIFKGLWWTQNDSISSRKHDIRCNSSTLELFSARVVCKQQLEFYSVRM